MEFEQGLLYHVDGLLRDEAWGDFIISGFRSLSGIS